MIINFSDYNRNEDIHITSILSNIAAGKDVYLKINTGTHAGSIGKVRNVVATSATSYNRKYRTQLSIKFDDRKNILKPMLSNVTWMSGFTGPTEWHHNKIVKPAPIKKSTCDKFDNELAEGNTVLFAYNQGRGRGPTVLIGRISKITERGTIYCKPFSFSKGSIWQNEMRITTNSHLVKVDEFLLDRILLAKLSD